jgi:hypothetical protein
MNKKGMELFSAMDGADDDMLLDALPPGMGTHSKKEKSRPWTDFFERPWVAAVISASVALAVLTGIVLAGRSAMKEPWDDIGATPGNLTKVKLV